jgi:hypothetical protein
VGRKRVNQQSTQNPVDLRIGNSGLSLIQLIERPAGLKAAA